MAYNRFRKSGKYYSTNHLAGINEKKYIKNLKIKLAKKDKRRKLRSYTLEKRMEENLKLVENDPESLFAEEY